MAYDDPRYRGASDDVDPGDYPYAPTGPGERTDGISRQGYARADLDDLFEDPAHGEPGRDRFGVHLVWELVLLVAVSLVGYLLYRDGRFLNTGGGLRGLMLSATVLGLLVLGAGLSLRAAVPNLSVGPIALASALYFAEHIDRGVPVAATQAVVLALAVGAAIALVSVALHVPAWAASFGAALAVVLWIQQHHQVLTLPKSTYQPLPHAAYWFGGFAALAVVGAVLGSVRSVRRTVGRLRPVSDPADRRGGGAAVVGIAALLGSSVLAAGAGMLTVLQTGRATPTDTSLALTGLALGGALLAGTSVYGRRGGLLGTVLATALLAMVVRYFQVAELRVSPLAVGAVAIGVGLVASRLVEAFGRPRPLFAEDDRWRTVAPTTATAPLPPHDQDRTDSRSTGWTSPLPASSADDRWGDDEWRGR
ncbi:ABC transporter permease [Planosporangium mesophilum]|uniref:Uncharacterized protein n=1 Tax=Planosporangium mesophilum TaxID=689768 RepID=A0A8J3X2Q8_9ACTN|nr:ABC transporter permease [Planosporangium mesophilum]NJC83826.1 ABC transporter permease [Planosporangium mesophilum]GII25176.1 hypothetical protein Pme01_47730 [Planosporangium mesophilum]